MDISVTRNTVVLKPNQARVLLRPFEPGGTQRIEDIISRIMLLSEADVGSLLDEVLAGFSQRHERIRDLFLERFDNLRDLLLVAGDVSEQRRLLIGSYFLSEYSLEAAALFNPSIVPHPDQTGLAAGSVRFILSLRATGEGHISSIVFRTGVIDAGNQIALDAPSELLAEARQTRVLSYEKSHFVEKLSALGLSDEYTHSVMQSLGNYFTFGDLRRSMQAELEQSRSASSTFREDQASAQGIRLLALSNQEVSFRPEQPISGRVIFPVTPSQRNGIEDARFVCFADGDGSHQYYATFTAYDGKVIVPQLVCTSDFLRFRFITMNGPAAQNKGMALFPRKVNGLYAMLSRQDNENIYLMFSDDIHLWSERQVLLRPKFPWELIQVGNCGSPIETEAGWLVLSHGVGPMREYRIGAFLLDRDDPSKVIGRLSEPLLKPNDNEREGYVPNVLYTCGALVHHGNLILPYGQSDSATGFAALPLNQLLSAMS